MELRQLRYFVEIAQSGSLNRAALELNITQPALSRQLQSLEKDLGVTLFERNVTGMTLTQQGQRLVDFAEDFVRRADTVHDYLLDDDQKVSGSVTIGAAPSLGQHFFAPIAQRAAEEYPSIDIKFREGNSFDMLAGLERAEIDFAFMIDPDPQKGLKIVPLFYEQLYLMGPIDDQTFPKYPIALSDLKNFPLAIYPKLTGPRKAIDKAILHSRTTLNIRYETNFHATIEDFVRRGLAYALVAKSAITNDPNMFSFAPVKNLKLLRTIIYMQARLRSSAVAKILDIAKSEVCSVVPGRIFEGCQLLDV